jgi:hypothetical protein
MYGFLGIAGEAAPPKTIKLLTEYDTACVECTTKLQRAKKKAIPWAPGKPRIPKLSLGQINVRPPSGLAGSLTT